MVVAFIADGEDAHSYFVAPGLNPAASCVIASVRSATCDAGRTRSDPTDQHSTSTSLAAASPGPEAAWQFAEAGARVRLSEMRGGGDMTPAHETDRLAEMVCSNSFRSDDADNNAVGLLHQEMRALGSLIMRAADEHRVPAGSALAVDRELSRPRSPARLEQHPNITIVRERIDALPDHPAIIATGPLTGSRLAGAIAGETGKDALAFFDAIAPDRPPRQHRHGHLLDGGALGQGRQGLHQLPDGQRPVRSLRRGAESTAKRPSSRSGRRTRPISKAACRSR